MSQVIHNQKTVVILGPHKSGTSALANAVVNLGVPMGEDLLAAHKSNPFGHFEDRDFLKINDEMLLSIHRTWHSPPSRIRMDSEVLPNFKDSYLELIDKKNGQNDIWGFKDPRSVLNIFSLHPYLRNPYFLVMRRSMEDTARSLHNRDKDSNAYNSSFEYALSLTKYYLDECTLFVQKFSNVYPIHEVHYEEMVAKPKKVISNVSVFLDLDLPPFAIKRGVEAIKRPEEVQAAKDTFEPPTPPEEHPAP